jgi:protein O-mannosyl-transferase
MNLKPPHNKLLLCLLLGLLSLLGYWRIARCDFVAFDDFAYITENPKVQAGLTLDGIAWAFHTGHSGNWHPLTWLSHMLDVQLYGLQPAGHHLTNLCFHLANTVLLFLLFNRMTGALWRSALVAGLFALHPTHVESVAWVSERKDVLSTFFFILTLLAYTRYSESECRRQKAEGRNGSDSSSRSGHFLHSAFHLLPSYFFFALGLMSKPMLVTLPFILLLLDYWPLQRFRFTSGDPTASARRFHPSSFILHPLLCEKLPFFLLSALSSAVTYAVQHAGGAVVPTAELSLPGRVANVLVAYLTYLEKLVWPAGLAFFYPRPDQWPAWRVASAVVVLVAITLLALRLLPGRRYPTVGWLWFLGTLVPVIGFVQVGEQAMADRYTYIPSIGLFVVAAWGAEEIARRSKARKTLIVSAAVIVLPVLLLVTQRQVAYWQTSEALFRRGLAVTKDNPTAEALLGRTLFKAGRLEEAEGHFLAALRLKPQDVDLQLDCATVMAREGKFAEAVPRFFEILRLSPGNADADFNLASIFTQQGDTARAIEHYRAGLKLKPDDADALNNLAWIRAANSDAAFRNGDEAVQLAQRACELTRRQNPMIVGTLAAAYAEAGRFDDAVTAAQKAHDLALAAGQKELAAKNQQLLELYQAHKPYHESPEPPEKHAPATSPPP